jgi:hypothetical protein
VTEIEDDERWASLPPEERRWFLDQVAGVDFRCVRTWRIFHGPQGWPFKVERVDEVPIKVVDIQPRKRA